MHPPQVRQLVNISKVCNNLVGRISRAQVMCLGEDEEGTSAGDADEVSIKHARVTIRAIPGVNLHNTTPHEEGEDIGVVVHPASRPEHISASRLLVTRTQ